MKIYRAQSAMKVLGVSKKTFYRYVQEIHRNGPIWTEADLERMRTLKTETLTRLPESLRPAIQARRLAAFILAVLLLSGIGYAQNATVTWDANTEPTLAGYNVYRSITSGLYSVPINAAVLPAPTFTDSTIFCNLAPYFYVVRAVDIYGNETPNSNEVVATCPTTPPAPVPPPTPVPAPVPIPPPIPPTPIPPQADTVAPVISFRTPDGTSFNGNDKIIELNVADNVGVEYCVPTVNGTDIQPTDARWIAGGTLPPIVRFRLQLQAIPKGTYVLGATCRDAAGNMGAANPISVVRR